MTLLQNKFPKKLNVYKAKDTLTKMNLIFTKVKRIAHKRYADEKPSYTVVAVYLCQKWKSFGSCVHLTNAMYVAVILHLIQQYVQFDVYVVKLTCIK